MSTRILLSALILIATMGHGCRPLYRASIPNQPMLHQGKEAEVKVGLETGSGYAHVNFAPTDHIMLTAGGNAWSNRHTTLQYGELGFGYYRHTEGWGMSVMGLGGLGLGSVIHENRTIFNPNEPSSQYDIQYARLSVQPGAFYLSDELDIGFGVRASALQWLSPTEYERQNAGTDVYADPFLTVRTGTNLTKFFLDVGLTVPLYRSITPPINPLHVGFGISVSLYKGVMQPDATDRATEQ